MTKKQDTTNINNISKGILDTLQMNTLDEKSNKLIKPEDKIIKSDNSEIPKVLNNDESKRVNIKNSKGMPKEKNKRSFMLNDTAVQQLKMLSMALDKDLGEIVIEALDIYYRKNEKKVEQVITDYFGALKKK